VKLLDRVAGHVPVVTLARRNVSRATARSVLAVVAVVIGVVAVGGIGVGGESFKQNQLAAYEGFGGVATVTPVDFVADGPDEADQTLSDSELTRLRRTVGSGTVTPVLRPSGTTVRTASGEALVTVQVTAVQNPSQFYDLRAGEYPTGSERAVVVGSRVAADEDLAVGDRLTVAVDGSFTRSYRVSGILESQGFSDPLQADRTVFVPTGQFDDPEYTSALVQIDPRERSLDAVEEDIEEEFNARETTVFVSQVQQQREQMEAFFEQVNQFLLGIGAVSLVVSAVTVTNTMLMSIAEREGELGVLRAVGYSKLAVVRLVVAEATLLGTIGVLVGVPLTLGVGLVTNYYLLSEPLSFTATGLGYVGVGAVLGVAVALLGGVYPAWKAANRRPVEALD
jgi:putative ABC transport system permease protein